MSFVSACKAGPIKKTRVIWHEAWVVRCPSKTMHLVAIGPDASPGRKSMRDRLAGPRSPYGVGGALPTAHQIVGDSGFGGGGAETVRLLGAADRAYGLQDERLSVIDMITIAEPGQGRRWPSACRDWPPTSHAAACDGAE